MSVFGPLSSIFDFLTFASCSGCSTRADTEFRSGWFVESLATQTLVIYVIRTRRVPFLRSRPSRPMMVLPPACAADRGGAPLHAARRALGFATLPLPSS